MVKIIERDFDERIEIPGEREDKLYKILQSSLGDITVLEGIR